MSSIQRRTSYVLGFLLILIYLTRLGHPGFLAPGEGRYAEAARTMVVTGDWVVPRVNGQVHLEKPPLMYWLTAASFSVFGIHESSARLVPVLCSLLAAFVLFLLGRRIYGELGGWLSAFVLLTGMTWSVYGRFLTTDVPAIAFQVVALWAFWRARETDARRYLFALSASLAACVLVRGMLALVFPFIVIAAYSVIRREWRPLDLSGWLWAALLFVALTVPWHVAVEMKIPGFLNHYLLENHIARFFGNYPPRGVGNLSLAEFWGVSLAGLLPWSVFLPIAIAGTWTVIRREKRMPAGDLFGLLWVGSILLFVSISPARMERYFLPACPGFALWMGGRLSADFTAGGTKWTRGWLVSGAAAIILVGLALAWVPLWPKAPEIIPRGKGIISLLPWIGSFFALGGIFAVWAVRRGRPHAAVLWVVCGTTFGILGAQQVVARLDPFLSMRQVSEALAARNRIPERVIVDGYYEVHEGLDSYAGRSLYEGLEYYSGREASVLRTSLGKNEEKIRWDASFHPSIEPFAFERMWARGEPALFITRWETTARELILHYPDRTRVIGIYDSAWVLANHDGEK